MTWKRILRGFGISLIQLFTTEPQGLMVKTTCWKADVCKLHHCCRVALSLTDWVMRMFMPSHSRTITFWTWNFEIFGFFSPLILQTRHSCMIEWTLKDFSFHSDTGQRLLAYINHPWPQRHHTWRIWLYGFDMFWLHFPLWSDSPNAKAVALMASLLLLSAVAWPSSVGLAQYLRECSQALTSTGIGMMVYVWMMIILFGSGK